MKKLLVLLLTATLIGTVVLTGCTKAENNPVDEKVQETVATQETITNKKPQKDEPITKEEAKKIALNDKNLRKKDVELLRADIEEDDGVLYYEVKFKVGNTKYEYDIHRETGHILKYDKEKINTPERNEYVEPATERVTEKPVNRPVEKATEKPTEKKPDRITESRAKEIALNHANVTNPDYIRVREDYDDGVKYYDVEFRKGRYEYDYEIHKETGRILEFDKDVEDLDD